MDEKSKDVTLLLAYIYLQQAKFMQALTYYKALRLLYPKDCQIILAYSYCLRELGNFSLSLSEASLAETFAQKEEDHRLSALLKSQSLWSLGQKQEARTQMQNYLKRKEVLV